MCPYSWDYMINYCENEKVDHICIDKNNSPRSEHRVNIKSVSVWWHYVLSNT